MTVINGSKLIMHEFFKKWFHQETISKEIVEAQSRLPHIIEGCS